MVHAESMSLGCVCPECGYRCRECLGTDTVWSREDLKRLKDDPALAEKLFEVNEDPPQRHANPDEYGRE